MRTPNIQNKPEGASDAWISKEMLTKWAHLDESGKTVAITPYRLHRCGGYHDIVYRPDLDLFYRIDGGEPIPLWKILRDFHHYVPLTPDQIKKAEQELAEIEKQEEAKKPKLNLAESTEKPGKIEIKKEPNNTIKKDLLSTLLAKEE